MEQINLDRLQIALPRISSLVFAGSALYVGLIRPLSKESERLARVGACQSSCSNSQCAMGGISIASSLLGINAYRLTNQPLWLYGSLAMAAILPLTFMSFQKRINKTQRQLDRSRDQDRGCGNGLFDWIWRHRIRILLAIAGSALFYTAQGRASAYFSYRHPVVVVANPVVNDVVTRIPTIKLPVAPAV